MRFLNSPKTSADYFLSDALSPLMAEHVTHTSGLKPAARIDGIDLVRRFRDARDSVAGLLRLQHHTRKDQFKLGFVGTAWCAVTDRTFVSAFHAFNEGKPRDPNDRFYVVALPNGGPQAFPMEVSRFHLEDGERDISVFDVDRTELPQFQVPALAVRLDDAPEGTRVVTYGFPAPVVTAAAISTDGRWRGGEFVLIGHANEGIVAAKYAAGNSKMYQFNVNWHHGESGGPIMTAHDGSVFAMMQNYRNIESPHGIIPGPHQGLGLSATEAVFRAVGANVL